MHGRGATDKGLLLQASYQDETTDKTVLTAENRIKTDTSS
jgi:hypothetical protein